MKKTFITVALLAVLGTMATSCQKEEILDSQSVIAENCTVYTVHYAIDGVMHTSTLNTEEEYNVLILQLMLLAREGHNVVFSNNEISNYSLTKETLHYSTPSETEAAKWAMERTKEGYTVYVNYDERTGLYNCTAVR